MRSILLSLCFSAFSFLHAANADDIQARDESWEDPTCKDVARAIIMTEIYPSYSYEMPLVREDGTYRPFIERKFSPTERQEKRHFEKEWRSTPRLGVEWSSWDRSEPTLTNCKLVGSEVEATGGVTHYRMNWTSLPYRAEMDAWISQDHQMLTRVTRRYIGGGLEFPEERVALLFKYDGLLVTSPLRRPRPSDSVTSCDRVKRMVAKFNETQAVQMTMRFVNNGLGEPYFGQYLHVGAKEYSRDTGWPWEVRDRVIVPTEIINKCKLLGFQEVNGIATSLYEYERPDLRDGELRILTWISDETHLPVKAHFTRLKPVNGFEVYITYAFDPDVKEPI